MARPSKPIALVQGHRTKAEIAARKKAEKELLSGIPLREWPEVRNNPAAHKEFLRIRKLLKAIGHNDDLYGLVINTQCKLRSEELQMWQAKDAFVGSLKELKEGRHNLEFLDYMKLKAQIQAQIINCDKAIMQKRKLLLDISKENIQTIQSVLRSIPKKPEKQEESPMAAFLKRKQGVSGA